MRSTIIHGIATMLCIAVCTTLSAQDFKHRGSHKGRRDYPASFSMTKNDFDDLFLCRVNEQLTNNSNIYLNKATVLANAKAGNKVSLKIKLDYFKNAILLAEVNGLYSTQVFIISADKKIFYKGRFEKNELLMDRCAESEIVSE